MEPRGDLRQDLRFRERVGRRKEVRVHASPASFEVGELEPPSEVPRGEDLMGEPAGKL